MLKRKKRNKKHQVTLLLLLEINTKDIDLFLNDLEDATVIIADKYKGHCLGSQCQVIEQ